MSIQTTIATAAETLPPSLARIARVISENPNTAVESTISELAALCETSVASVVRFCRVIGLRGYAALRMSLAAELGRESVQFSAPTGFGSEIAVGDSLRDAAGKIAALELLAIEETVGNLDYDVLADAVEAIDQAHRILLFGVGASRLVADDLGHKLLRIGRTAIVLSDAHEASAAAALSAPKAVAIGFSNSGTTAETVRFLQTARAAGSATIGVTSAADSPLAETADHALFTHARESRFRAGAMVSRIAQLALVDCIFVGVAQRRHAHTVHALQRTADAAQALRGD
ncbi:putative HTH-type transcriptional regulator YbbH [Microbacterium oxydans]|uniref:Putative HTH-type transcriptional regulator YbbH n=1 Tax=Microbacterium oxydans TaxID=82380 RepID=A0A0F0LI01_9MICO|nr:MurR/RpiR family transcriptional regulator [Microbacterium oxydans]KJL32842.1 putative HTH-type transcriptional regulator YbbH [Microbacterium oxydans]CAH0252202.1 putative HTH-type transcriptional regulator YbbH [Microbacterium oxydans]